LGEYERAVRAVLYPVDGSDAFGITLLIPLLVVAGTWTGVRAVRRGRVAEGGLRLGLAGTIFYVGVVSCLVEAGPELSRFRFVTDALSIALAAALLARWRSSGGA
jgi:hypothetical protein